MKSPAPRTHLRRFNLRRFTAGPWRSVLLGSIAAVIAAAAPSAQAVSDSWKADAAGLWNNTASWTGANIPGSTVLLNSADIATFGFTLTAGRAVTVDANRNIGGITFSNTSAFGYTLSGGNLRLSSGGVIQLTGNTGAHTETISSPIEIQGDGGTATFTSTSTLATRLLSITGGITGVSAVGNTTTLTLNGTQSPSGVLENAVSGVVGDGGAGGKLAIVKNDAGAWTLSNTGNSFSGGTTLNAGILRATTAGALGLGGVTLAGGQLHLINNANTAFNNNVSVTGSTTISATRVSGSAGTASHTLGTLSIGAQTLTLAKFSATTTGTLTFGATTLTGNATFATSAGTVLVLGATSGNFSITKDTAATTGTLVLAANNSYNGGTNVNVGTLQVGNNGTTGNLGAGAVSVASGAVLSFARSNAATFTNAISGAGIVRVANNNSIIELTNASHTGSTQIQSGVLLTNNLTPNIVLGITGNPTLYGVLGLKSDFTGALGTAPGNISWATGVSSSGGFAVMDAATRSVNIGGNVTPDTLTLNTGGFVGGTLSGSNSRIKFGDVNGTALGTVDFKNSINLGSGDRGLIFTVDGAARYPGIVSGNISGSGLASGTGDAITKFGNANLLLSGTNTYTGRTVVGGTAAIVLGSANAFSPNTWFHLDGGAAGTTGGILGLGSGNLAANLGQAGGNVHFNTSGGFAAFGADRSVTLNGGAALVWASTTSFLGTGQNLVLSQAKADGKITLTNDLDLGAATRTVFVNRGTAALDGVLSGNLSGTGGGLVKSGAGLLEISGTGSSYTGTTTVTAGTLIVSGSIGGSSAIAVNAGGTLLLGGTSDRIANTASVTLAAGASAGAGGILNSGGLNEGPVDGLAPNSTDGMGLLTLSANSTIDFFTGTVAHGSNLLFSALAYTPGDAVRILNWTGSPGGDNGDAANDRLLFSGGSSFTDAQLSAIQFFSDSGATAFATGATQISFNGYYEIVPVPEPGTVLTGGLLLGLAAFRERRRLGLARPRRTSRSGDFRIAESQIPN